MKKHVNLISIITGIFIIFNYTSCNNTPNSKTITVVASPVPHAVILEEAAPLLKEAGYELKIKVVNDYITPNQAVSMGSADANFFQHKPYLNQYNLEHKSDIVSVAEIHIEPIGLYSKRLKKDVLISDQIKDGDVILMSNSPSDQSRLLFLLAESGIITLHAEATPETANIKDISTMKKEIIIRNDINPDLLISMYNNDEATLILINSNFAMDAGLNPLEDALLLESTINNPYANILAVRKDKVDSAKTHALVQALTSEKISSFIKEIYGGSILSLR